MMTIATIENGISQLGDTVFVISHKIHGNPPGALDELLRKIRELLEDVKTRIVRAITGPLDTLRQVAESVYRAIRGIVDAIGGAIERVVSGLVSQLWNALQNVIQAFTNALHQVRAMLTETLNRITSQFTDFTRQLRDGLNQIGERIRDFASRVASSVVDGLTGLVTRIREIATSIRDGIIEWGREVGEKIQAFYQMVRSSIEDWLRRTLERIRQAYEYVQDKIEEFRLWIMNQVIPSINAFFGQSKQGFELRKDAIESIVTGSLKGDAGAIRNGIAALLKRVGDKDLSMWVITVVMGAVIIPASFKAIAEVPLEIIQQELRARMPVYPLDAGILANAVHRGLIGEGEAAAQVARAGLSAENMKLVVESTRPLPSIGPLQEASLRGDIDEARFRRVLKMHGFTDADVEMFARLRWRIPPIVDIIRFAVREVFTPEVAEKFGIFEDYPGEVSKWAAKQGLTEEWAKRYWGAHWDLPSPTMGFEMLHRGIIDEDELKLLLRALDVMPYWRERLIKLSYAPYTRVDVRRMYQVGILDYDGVIRAYKDIGYNEEKAKNLADFTVRYYSPEEETEVDKYREVSKSLVITAYKRGILTREEAEERLKNLRYFAEDVELMLAVADAELALTVPEPEKAPLLDKIRMYIVDGYKRGVYRYEDAKAGLSAIGLTEAEVDWYLTVADYEVSHRLKTLALGAVEEKYVTRTYTQSDVIVALGQMGLDTEEVKRLLEIWSIEREARTRKPTEAQFRAALLSGLITSEEYMEELRGLGYEEKYVMMLTALAVGRKPR